MCIIIFFMVILSSNTFKRGKTMASKKMTKAMTLRRRIRKEQFAPNSMEVILYCFFVALLLDFIIFTVFASIAEHSKKNLQVESEVTHLGNSFLDGSASGPPLAVSPFSPSKTMEEEAVSEDIVSSVKEETSAFSTLESNSTVSTKEEENVTSSTLENDFIVPATEYEINLVVQAVQHEVGAWEGAYPNADLDEVQQIMARVIINQVGLPDAGDSIYDVLFLHPGHFMPIEELEGIDPYEERTRKNVLKVLRGKDSHSSKVVIEMSFSPSCTFEDCVEVMESQVGPVNPYFWTVLSNGRTLMFAEPAKED